MSGVDHPLTIRWVLFSFRGRIGRKSFWLGALGMILVQAVIVVQIVSTPENSPAFAFWGLVMGVAWLVSAWVGLALAVKRLHDLDLPAALAVCLLIPAISLLSFLFLAVMPSKQETNRHGPPPFPRA